MINFLTTDNESSNKIIFKYSLKLCYKKRNLMYTAVRKFQKMNLNF